MAQRTPSPEVPLSVTVASQSVHSAINGRKYTNKSINSTLDQSKASYWWNDVISNINDSVIQLLNPILSIDNENTIEIARTESQYGCLIALKRAKNSLIKAQNIKKKLRINMIKYRLKDEKDKVNLITAQKIVEILSSALENENKIIVTIEDFMDTDNLYLKFYEEYDVIDIQLKLFVRERLKYRNEILGVISNFK